MVGIINYLISIFSNIPLDKAINNKLMDKLYKIIIKKPPRTKDKTNPGTNITPIIKNLIILSINTDNPAPNILLIIKSENKITEVKLA